MKKNQNKSQKFQVKLLVFMLLSVVAAACTVSYSEEITGNEIVTGERKSAEQINYDKTAALIYLKSDAEEETENGVNPRVKICKKYAACRCQTYKSCMEDLKDNPVPDEPGVLECIMKSSCKSLCAGKPDCGGSRAKKTPPKKSNCSQIRCSRDSDCPGDCHGGCSDGRCYSF